MDLMEKQRSRRKRGMSVLAIAMFVLAIAIRQASLHQVRAVDFVVIYFSGVPLGAGIAMVVASYKMMHEIAGK